MSNFQSFNLTNVQDDEERLRNGANIIQAWANKGHNRRMVVEDGDYRAHIQMDSGVHYSQVKGALNHWEQAKRIGNMRMRLQQKLAKKQTK